MAWALRSPLARDKRLRDANGGEHRIEGGELVQRFLGAVTNLHYEPAEALVDITPGHYAIDRRLERACDLLLTGQRMAEVAEEFKRFRGSSPGSYRRR